MKVKNQHHHHSPLHHIEIFQSKDVMFEIFKHIDKEATHQMRSVCLVWKETIDQHYFIKNLEFKNCKNFFKERLVTIEPLNEKHLHLIQQLYQYHPLLFKDFFIKAVNDSYIPTVEAFLNSSSLTLKHLKEAFKIAIDARNFKLVKLFVLKDKIHPAEDHNAALIYACESGEKEFVRTLLKDARVNPSDRKNLALQKACIKNYSEIIYMLLENPRFIEGSISTFLFNYAFKKENIELFKFLLDHQELHPPLTLFNQACKNGHLSIVECLIEDIRFNSINSLKEALEIALNSQQLKIADLLTSEIDKKMHV